MSYPAIISVLRHTPATCRLLALAFLTALASQLTAQPQSRPKTEEEVIRLPEFNVSAERADAYRATDAMSVGRIRAQLIDTPASVSVITKDFLQDLGSNAMYDATKYLSGMSGGRGAGAGGIIDRHVIRGFENDGRTIDNFGTGFQANFDPMLIERIEVVKGPNSILAPTGTPGGSINVITKSPEFTQADSATVEVGNFSAQKVSMDSTGPLPFGGSHLAYRVIGSYQDTSMFIPGKVKQGDIMTELAYKFSSTSLLTVKYSYQDWKEKDSTADANAWGWAVDPNLPVGTTITATPPSGFTYKGRNGDTTWDTRTDRVNIAQAQFTSSLTDSISMRLGAFFAYDHMGQDTGFPTFPGVSNRYNPFTGILTPNFTWAKDATGTFVPTFSAAYDPTNIGRIATRAPVWTQNAQFQNDYAGNFKVGDVSLQPVVGFAFVHQVQTAWNLTAPLPSVNLFAPNDNPPHPSTDAYTFNSNTQSRNAQQQLYGAIRGGFYGDRLFITGGASRVFVDNESTNVLKGTPSFLKGHHDTFLGGFLAKPVEGVSVYYSYSTNSSPTAFNNQPLWKDGKEHEFGVKTEFFQQRLSFNAAHFQIIQTNLVTPNPAFNTDPANNPPNLISNQTNRGFEFEMVGGLTKELSIITSYTTMKLRDTFGRRLRNIPDRTLALLLNYRLMDYGLKGLNVFAGAYRVGNTAGDTPSSSATALGVIEQTSFYVADRTIVNAGAGYTWQRFRFNLNVDNLFNTQAAWEPASRFAVSPYPGINYRLTTTVKF